MLAKRRPLSQPQRKALLIGLGHTSGVTKTVEALAVDLVHVLSPEDASVSIRQCRSDSEVGSGE